MEARRGNIWIGKGGGGVGERMRRPKFLRFNFWFVPLGHWASYTKIKAAAEGFRIDAN
jgi:hypothetical protein